MPSYVPDRTRETTPDATLRYRRFPTHSLSISILPIVVCALWGGNSVAIRLALESLPPFGTASIRGWLAAAALLVYVRATAQSLRVSPLDYGHIAVLIVLSTGIFALFYLALGQTTGANASVLLYLYPLFTALMAHLFVPGERLTSRTTLGLCLGFSGALLTLSDTPSQILTHALTGNLLAFSSACLWALQTVYIKRTVPRIPPVSLVFYTTVGPGLAFLLLSAFLDPPATLHWSPLILLALGYQALVVDAATSVLWVRLIQRSHAAGLTAHTFLTPLFSVLLNVLVFGDPVSTRLAVALGLVVLGLTVVERSPSAPALVRSPSRPLGVNPAQLPRSSPVTTPDSIIHRPSSCDSS